MRLPQPLSSYSQKPGFVPLVRKGGVPRHLGGKLSGMERGWDWMREWLLPGELLIIRVLLLQGLLRFFIHWMTSTFPLVTLADQWLCFLPSWEASAIRIFMVLTQSPHHRWYTTLASFIVLPGRSLASRCPYYVPRLRWRRMR